MIIATGSVAIDENAKLAEDATTANEAALKGLKTSMDGKITVSTQAPFSDGVEHADGDLWMIQSDGLTTAMYTYGAGGWSEKQWDQDTMNVRELSALSANLGTVNAGTIDGVTINGSYINGGSITQDFTTGNDHYQLWADYNGFHYRTTLVSSGHHQDVKMNDGGLVVSSNFASPISGRTVSPTVIAGSNIYTDQIAVTGVTASTVFASSDVTASGVYASSRVASGNFTMSGGSVFGTQSGSVYFEYGTGDSGNSAADLHAGSFNKMSQLSVKRNIQNVTGDYALAQIMGTDVKRYDYKLSDNSQQTNIGPIIDDENPIGSKKYGISSDMINSQSDGVSIDNEVGLLMAAVKELTKRNSDLQLRVTQLESEVKA